MSRGLLAAVLALVLGGAVATGARGDLTVGVIPVAGGQLLSETEMPVRAEGTVAISFHGDLASGCAAAGLCGLRGTFTLRPQARDLVIVGTKGHKPLAILTLSESARTATRWQAPAPACADAVGSDDGIVELPVTRGTVAVALTSARSGGGPAFAGRCGGPLPGDLAGALPVQHIAIANLMRGRRRIDLGGVRQFASHGLAGTVTSTAALDLGAPKRSTASPAGAPISESIPGIHFARVRILSARYRLAGLTGSTITTFRGRADADACSPLGSCGAAGSLTTRPTPATGNVVLFVEASARRPVRDLRTALGLSSAGRATGLRVFGEGTLAATGTVEQSLTAPGRPACHDLRSLGIGQVVIDGDSGGLRVAYGPALTQADSLRTRCPGPSTADLVDGRPLASGILARAALSHRVLRVHLDRGPRFAGDGYAGETRADLVITLRRVSVRSRIIREPVPDGP